jgi:hypothetical protein
MRRRLHLSSLRQARLSRSRSAGRENQLFVQRRTAILPVQLPLDIAGIVEAHSLGNTNICLLQKADGRQSLDSLRRDTPHECHWTPVHLDIPTILIVDIGH